VKLSFGSAINDLSRPPRTNDPRVCFSAGPPTSPQNMEYAFVPISPADTSARRKDEFLPRPSCDWLVNAWLRSCCGTPNPNEDSEVLLPKLRVSSVQSASKPSLSFRLPIDLSVEDSDVSYAPPRNVTHAPAE
jgi:hypothetical protein